MVQELIEQEFAWFSKKPSILLEQWSMRKKLSLFGKQNQGNVYVVLKCKAYCSIPLAVISVYMRL